MPISVGDKLPETTVWNMTSQGPTPLRTSDIMSLRKVVLVSVPGAFTPTCHAKHLPGFIARADEIKAKGIDTIACISINDVHVMNAWSKQLGADGRVMFLADGNGEFTSAIGMTQDSSAVGMGTRSKRYAMVVDNGTVTSLHIEPQAGQAIETSAETVLADL